MYIRLDEHNAVAEIIPDADPVFPGMGVEKRYPADFIAGLTHFPDDTEAHATWIYDAETGTFSPPPEPEPGPEPTPEPGPDGTTIADLEDTLCEMDAAYEERFTNIEDALCELSAESEE